MQARLVLLIAVLALTACAKRPHEIAPVTAPATNYIKLTCEELAGEHTRVTTELAALSDEQNDAATGDALGVLLIGVPVSSMTGADRSNEIASLKGQKNAIEHEQLANACNG